VLALGGCAGRFVPLQRLQAPPCASASTALTWVGPAAGEQRDRLSAWCRSVGPPVVRAPARRANLASHAFESSAGLVVVSWNVHEGAGDIVRVVDRLRPAEVIVLVQEAMRAGEEVPAAIPAGVGVPRRAAAHRAPTADIVDVADALGLWIAYVPSMRNGRSGREDRGCAILSSLPLSDAIAIELPWVRQRRVAVMARAAARSGPIQVVSAHLDNRPGRREQSAALAEWLAGHADPDRPLVVGADLNTWFGAGEDTVRQIDRVVPLAKLCGERPTFRFGRRLDYLFATEPIAECVVSASTYGSDHRPLVMALRP
jgi:endonuclease/exonuclease/phosphatase family metal-dependent hydrolase